MCRYDGPWKLDRKHGDGIWSRPYTASDMANAATMGDEEKASWRKISIR